MLSSSRRARMILSSLVLLVLMNVAMKVFVGLQFGCRSPSSIISSSCSSVAVSQKHPPMGQPRLEHPHLEHSWVRHSSQ